MPACLQTEASVSGFNSAPGLPVHLYGATVRRLWEYEGRNLVGRLPVEVWEYVLVDVGCHRRRGVPEPVCHHTGGNSRGEGQSRM